MLGEPAFDGVVPALYRAPTVSTDDQEPHEEPNDEDSDSNAGEHSSGPGGWPGLADRVDGTSMEMLCVGHGSSVRIASQSRRADEQRVPIATSEPNFPSVKPYVQVHAGRGSHKAYSLGCMLV